MPPSMQLTTPSKSTGHMDTRPSTRSSASSAMRGRPSSTRARARSTRSSRASTRSVIEKIVRSRSRSRLTNQIDGAGRPPVVSATDATRFRASVHLLDRDRLPVDEPWWPDPARPGRPPCRQRAQRACARRAGRSRIPDGGGLAAARRLVLGPHSHAVRAPASVHLRRYRRRRALPDWNRAVRQLLAGPDLLLPPADSLEYGPGSVSRPPTRRRTRGPARHRLRLLRRIERNRFDCGLGGSGLHPRHFGRTAAILSICVLLLATMAPTVLLVPD